MLRLVMTALPRSRRRAVASHSLLVAGVALAACGSSHDLAGLDADASADASGATGDDAAFDTATSDTTPPLDNGAPSTVYPAPHPAPPVLTNAKGGTVLTTPKVMFLYYAGYPYETALDAFGQAVGASAYWSAATAEYGVGPLTWVSSKELTGPAPVKVSDTEIDTFFHDQLIAGAFGPPDASTIYTFFYPTSTTISSAGSQSCSSFGGYHSNVAAQVSGMVKTFAYAVIPTCSGFSGLQGVQEVTGALTHELAEAVTDPFPTTSNGAASAYENVDDAHFAWTFGTGGESGDLCVPEPDAFYKDPILGLTVQRTWSNAQAAAGHDPCAPSLGVPFFASAPVLPNAATLKLPIGFGRGAIATQSVRIPVGQSRTVEIDLYSDQATSGPWSVTAHDAFAELGDNKTLSFTWDRTSGVNGEKLHLTIAVHGPSSIFPGAHGFTIYSTLGAAVHAWTGLVTEE